MSLFSDIGDGLSSAAKTVAHVASDAVDVAGSVAEDMVNGAVDGLKHTFDSPWTVLKGAAFATVLSPFTIVMTGYELADATYQETDKKVKERNG